MWRNAGLSITLFGLFLISLVGQSLTGWLEANERRAQHHQQRIELRDYLRSGDFVETTMENWESEFLQMFAYVLLTAFLYQRGSSESKSPDEPEAVDRDPQGSARPDAPAWVRAGGWRLKIYQYSLSLAFLTLFSLSFALHALGGAQQLTEERALHGQAPVSVAEYLATSRFWFESFQNWQSEFLAIGSMVVLSIWLRQRGSPESKPVDSPHSQTGSR